MSGPETSAKDGVECGGSGRRKVNGVSSSRRRRRREGGASNDHEQHAQRSPPGKEPQQQAPHRRAHEAISNLGAHDLTVVTSALQKMAAAFDAPKGSRGLDEPEEYRGEAVGDRDLVASVLKRDVVSVLCALIASHSEMPQASASKDIVLRACRILLRALRLGEGKALSQAGRALGCRPLFGLLRSSCGRTPGNAAIVCDLLNKITETEKLVGAVAKASGGVELVAQIIIRCNSSNPAVSEKKTSDALNSASFDEAEAATAAVQARRSNSQQNLTRAALQLLHKWCRSLGSNSDAFARLPSADLTRVLQCCSRSIPCSLKTVIAGLELLCTVSARGDRATAALARGGAAVFALGAAERYDEDKDIVERAVRIVRRLSSSACGKKQLVRLKSFDRLYPLVAKYLADDILLLKLGQLLWKLLHIQKENDSSATSECATLSLSLGREDQVSSAREVKKANTSKGESKAGGEAVLAGATVADADANGQTDSQKASVIIDAGNVLDYAAFFREQVVNKFVLSEAAIPKACPQQDLAYLASSICDSASPATLLAPKPTQVQATLRQVERLRSNIDIAPRCVYERGSDEIRECGDAAGRETTAHEDGPVSFESRFAGGNLLRAVRTAPFEYDLTLQRDTNNKGQAQWFYFSMKGLLPGKEYRFHVCNLEKSDSLFNQGLRPLAFCPRAQRERGVGWLRAGHDIIYMANPLDCAPTKSGVSYSLFFSFQLDSEFTFSEGRDDDGQARSEQDSEIFLAYCYPYSYSDLESDLQSIVTPLTRHCVRQSSLCQTLGGLDCPLLTITNFSNGQLQESGLYSAVALDNLEYLPMDRRSFIVISARVHPGESNASWVMRGALHFLVSNDPIARRLRNRVIFKVVPMLNPDGVQAGNTRCNMAGIDLNRQWSMPTLSKSPTILSLKKLIKSLHSQGPGKCTLFLDMHGHSRKPGFFLFGCEDPKRFGAPEEIFPGLLQLSARKDAFALDLCTHKVLKYKSDCARVVCWKDLKIQNSFTLEASLCGNKSRHFSQLDFMQMGCDTAKAMWGLVDPAQTLVDRVVKPRLAAMFPEKFLLPLPCDLFAANVANDGADAGATCSPIKRSTKRHAIRLDQLESAQDSSREETSRKKYVQKVKRVSRLRSKRKAHTKANNNSNNGSSSLL